MHITLTLTLYVAGYFNGFATQGIGALVNLCELFHSQPRFGFRFCFFASGFHVQETSAITQIDCVNDHGVGVAINTPVK